MIGLWRYLRKGRYLAIPRSQT